MKPRIRTGLNALKARVKVRGLQAIDRRNRPARALLAWRGKLITDLGGERELTAEQLALVELATRSKLYVDSVDVWLMAQPSLVNARRRAILPVVRERQQLADSLARLLGQLGLERRQPRALDLGAYLRDRYGPSGATVDSSSGAAPDPVGAGPSQTDPSEPRAPGPTVNATTSDAPPGARPPLARGPA